MIILLAGAGHAHLAVLREAARFRAAGHRLLLVAPRWFHYSGTATAVLSTQLPAAQGRVDVVALAARHQVHHIDSELLSADPATGSAVLADGRPLRFDLLSLNVGSVVAVPEGAAASGIPAKPLAGLSALADAASVAVIGGGATGVELACTLRCRPSPPSVRLWVRGAVAAGLPAGAQRRAAAILAQHRVSVCEGQPAASDTARRVYATGLVPAPLMQTLGLPCADDGGLITDRTLASVAHPRVFAVGDCAHFAPRPLPRVGVFGVRAAPVLIDNLLARAAGQPLRDFRPPVRFLAILNLGTTGLAVYGRWWWESPAMLAWKRWIDRRWLRRYQDDPGAREQGG